MLGLSATLRAASRFTDELLKTMVSTSARLQSHEPPAMDFSFDIYISRI